MRFVRTQPGQICLIVMLAAAVMLGSVSRAEARPPTAHIVIDAASGKMLLGSGPDHVVRPASLTKMMTLYLLFEDLEAGRIKLSARIRFSRNASRQPPSKLGVRPGGSITVKTAILALSVKSANDVAVAVAERLNGSVKNFARRMNAKARALGMSRTWFANPSGLPHPRQVTTVRDMATLARAIRYRHKGYYKYFQAKSFRFGKRTYRSHNRFVKQYKGADGLKTGYINASGFNLAASAVRGGRRLIGVIVGGRTAARRDKALTRLMDRGFRIARTSRALPYAGIVPVGVDRRTGRPAAPPRRPGAQPPAPSIAALVAAATPEPPSPGETPSAETLSAPSLANRAVPAPPARGSRSLLPVAEAERAAAVSRRALFAAQVGAVASKRAAERLASTRLAALGPAVDGGAPKVDELRLRSGRRLYRARIAGLTGDQARNACKTLQKAGRDCLVVGPPRSG